MHISLTAELEPRVKAKVESGLYNNASEVTCGGLRFMDAHEEWVHEVKLLSCANISRRRHSA